MSAVPPGSVPTENASGTTAGGNAGQGVSLEQLMAMVGALAASVQTVTSQVGSLTENINKLSVQGETDTGMSARWVGAANPFDDQFRSAAARDQIGATVQVFMGNMVTKVNALMDEYLKYTAGVWARSLDHFGALPPIAPRSATGPGTTGA